MSDQSEVFINDQSGFALVVVLIFISILSEIILSMMNSTVFAAKTLENFDAYSRYINLTDIALEQAKKDLIEGNMICFENACPVEGDFLKSQETLTYKLDFLATEPCFKIKNAEKPGVDFFKVLVKVGNSMDDAMTIQSTFVAEASTSIPCHEVIKELDGGWLSWRVVN